MYKNNENLVKSFKAGFLSTDDKIVTSSYKSEHSKKSRNGQLTKCYKVNNFLNIQNGQLN